MPPNYVLKSNPPYKLVYASVWLTPLEEALEAGFDVDRYVEMLEKARRELPRPMTYVVWTSSNSVSAIEVSL